MEQQPSQMELQRQKRIEENKRRMMEIGLSQAVDDIQASQQAEAAKAAPRRRTVVERVFVAEEDLRRSGREKKTVNYNEHAFFKAAEQALDDVRPKRRYLVPTTRTITEGSGRAVRCSGWSPCMGSAGAAAMERCTAAAAELAKGLANSFVKPLSRSMVSGGFWCNAPRGMTHAVATELGVDYKCSLMAYLPEGQPVPEDACHTNLAGDGWTMVWLPRKGEFGFSGGWRSFSLDMKLFPGDCVVVELVPKAQHRGEQDTRFSIILHVFRALEYETESEAAARRAAAALAGTIKVEDDVQGEAAAAVKHQDQPTQPLTQPFTQAEGQGPRPEGSPAAVDAAAAELSGEPQQAQQGGSAQQAQQGGKRKRQAQLTDAGAKRTRRSLSVDGNKGASAAAAAAQATGADRKAARAPKATAKAASQAQAGGGAAVGKKGRCGSKQKQGEGAAAGKRAAGAGTKRQSKKAAAVVVEEESYDVECILAVRPREGGGSEYLVKWLGWDEAWNTWEPRAHLDRPLAEYQLAPGLALADLE